MPEDERWECYPKGRGTECRRRSLNTEYIQERMCSAYPAKREDSHGFYSEGFLGDALSCILNALSNLYRLDDFRFHWDYVRLLSINIPSFKFGGDMKAITRKLLPEFPILESINLSSYSEREATDERSTFALDTETWRNLYCGLLFFREHRKLRDKLGKNIYKSETKTERLYLKHLKLKLSHELFHQTTAKWAPDMKKNGKWTKKAIPLLEVLTELRKFMFFLKYHNEFRELEQ